MAYSSTYKTFLMVKNGSAYEKLVDIVSYPDISGAPNSIEVTTLSDPAQVYIPGIKQTPDGLEFSTYYDQATYVTLTTTYENGVTHDFSIWFGGTETNGVATPDGSLGITAYLTVSLPGGGVDEARGMTVTLMPTTAPAYSS